MNKLNLWIEVEFENTFWLGCKKFNDKIFQILKIPLNSATNKRLLDEYYEYKRWKDWYVLLVIDHKKEIKKILDINKKPNDRKSRMKN